MPHGEAARKASEPDDLDRAGYKELGREGVRVGREALEIAKLTADRMEKVGKEIQETNRLLEEIRLLLAPKPKPDGA